MKYHFNKITDYTFDYAVEKITEELKKEGFGIVAQIDMKKILKEKLNKDFRNYKILEACNPNFAFRSLSAEDKIGIYLPCNIVVQEIDEKTTEIAVVNPVVMMESVENEEMKKIAQEIQAKLLRALAQV